MLLSCRQADMEGSTGINFAFEPYFAVMIFNYLLADRKPQAK